MSTADFRIKMLLRFILICVLPTTFLAANAQQIPNANFEMWEHFGDRTEPNCWNSLMSADLCMLCSFGASQRVFRDNRTVSGKGNCIRIQSTSAIGGIIVNGSITTGQVTAPSAVPGHGYNRTVKGNPEFSLRFTGKPDSLVFWARYSVTDKSDSALVSFLLHDDIEMTDPPRKGAENKPLAIAQKAFQTTGRWQRFSIPFMYIGGNRTRVLYLLGTFSSSFLAGKGNPNSTLWIDDVEMIYNRSSQLFETQTAATNQLNLTR